MKLCTDAEFLKLRWKSQKDSMIESTNHTGGIYF